jgi:hypothetical protein
MHSTTEWAIHPSLKFEALCFTGILTGDPFYTHYYPQEYEAFRVRLTPDVEAALAHIMQVIKTEGQGIISASLVLIFSVSDGDDIAALLAALDDEPELRRRFQQTPYYSDEFWAQYYAVQTDLRVVLEFLQREGFETYWRESMLPGIQTQIAAVESSLAGYNIVPVIEQVIGFPLASNRIDIDALYFVRPHGIKVVGSRFLSASNNSLEWAVRIAIHEMMHPPYNLANDIPLREALDTLRDDPFFMDKLHHHNPDFGYNTFEGLVEEDVVQTLDQLIGETFGVGRDPRERWRQSDDGLHVLAVALYSLLNAEDWLKRGETIRDALLRLFATGQFAPGRVEPLYHAFYAGYDDPTIAEVSQ